MYYKTKDEKCWIGFKPENTTGLVEVSDREWEAHLKTLTLEQKVLTRSEKAAKERAEKIRVLKEEIDSYSYIGLEIAMGLATREQYIDQITYISQAIEALKVLQAEK